MNYITVTHVYEIRYKEFDSDPTDSAPIGLYFRGGNNDFWGLRVNADTKYPFIEIAVEEKYQCFISSAIRYGVMLQVKENSPLYQFIGLNIVEVLICLKEVIDDTVTALNFDKALAIQIVFSDGKILTLLSAGDELEYLFNKSRYYTPDEYPNPFWKSFVSSDMSST